MVEDLIAFYALTAMVIVIMVLWYYQRTQTNKTQSFTEKCGCAQSKPCGKKY